MMKLGWRGFSYIDIDLSVTDHSEGRIDKPQRRRVLNPWDLLGCAITQRDSDMSTRRTSILPPRSALPVEHFSLTA